MLGLPFVCESNSKVDLVVFEWAPTSGLLTFNSPESCSTHRSNLSSIKPKRCVLRLLSVLIKRTLCGRVEFRVVVLVEIPFENCLLNVCTTYLTWAPTSSWLKSVKELVWPKFYWLLTCPIVTLWRFSAGVNFTNEDFLSVGIGLLIIMYSLLELFLTSFECIDGYKLWALLSTTFLAWICSLALSSI